MKLKTRKFGLNLIQISIFLSNIVPIFAATHDTDQPIHVESYIQSLDIQGNSITFNGRVIVTQGTIKIKADKVLITRINRKQGKEVIDGYGHPTTFYQIQNNGKLIKGCASRIHYEIDKKFILLIGNAYLERFESSISGGKITFSLKNQKIEAYSAEGKRVTTVLMQSKFQ